MSYDVPLRVAIGGNVDAGKCMKKNEKVLMFNGKINNIEDVIYNNNKDDEYRICKYMDIINGYKFSVLDNGI